LKALETLDLTMCNLLTELPDSIGALQALVELDLNSCSMLTELPVSLVRARRLTTVDFARCWNLSSMWTRENLANLQLAAWAEDAQVEILFLIMAGRRQKVGQVLPSEVWVLVRDMTH
jgi:hypothetical protein